jgi:hypothetical protein
LNVLLNDLNGWPERPLALQKIPIAQSLIAQLPIVQIPIAPKKKTAHGGAIARASAIGEIEIRTSAPVDRPLIRR